MVNLNNFLDTGVHHFEHAVDATACRALLNQALASRDFGPDLFQAQADFERNPLFKGVNPMPGRNLAETLAAQTLFIDTDHYIQDTLKQVLGPNYKIKDKKFVCGVPKEWIPGWVQTQIAETGVKNLGPYMKPEYRDITYFSGIDFHQDIIDWPAMGPHFITMYVYLDQVTVRDAPLHVLPGSHKFGATKFPHQLDMLSKDIWRYANGESGDNARSGTFKCELLTGAAGQVSLWHPFIIHGTQPDANSSPRISLRYLIQVADPDANVDCALHDLNQRIDGPLALASTRDDLDEQGKGKTTGNHVNKIEYSE